jgi:hypothetical protein
MKQIAILLSSMLLLALAGCEKNTPRVDRYKYVVVTDADSSIISYVDSTGITQVETIYGDWEYSWTQMGYKNIEMVITTGFHERLSAHIERNDTIIAACSVVGPVTGLYIVGYWF